MFNWKIPTSPANRRQSENIKRRLQLSSLFSANKFFLTKRSQYPLLNNGILIPPSALECILFDGRKTVDSETDPTLLLDLGSIRTDIETPV
jgi:hypothetical protein